MVIIKSSNARAVAALLDARPGTIRPSSAAWRRSSIACGARATRRCCDTHGGSTDLRARSRSAGEEIEKSADLVDGKVKRAIALAAKNIRAVAERQRPRAWTIRPVPGVTIRQRVLPLDRVGCYVPGGRYPLPSSLLMTAIPARVAGVPEVIVDVPEAGPDGDVRRARGWRLAVVPARRRARYRCAGLRHRRRFRASTGSSGPATPTSRRRRLSCRATARSTSSPARARLPMLSASERPAWIAADLIAQAEHDPDARAILDDSKPRGWRRPSPARCKSQLPSEGPARQSLASHGGIIVTRRSTRRSTLCNDSRRSTPCATRRVSRPG